MNPIPERSAIASLHDDCLRHIFCFLPIREVFSCGLVNRKWRKLIHNPIFLKVYFPVLKTDVASFPAPKIVINLANFLKLNEPPDIPKVSLKRCVRMTDQALSTLTIRTSSLSIKQCPRLSYAGVTTLFQNLISPAKIRVGKGTSIHLNDIFDLCVANRVHLQKLDVKEASEYLIPKSFVTRSLHCGLHVRSFLRLIDHNLLESPCHLDLRNETWVCEPVLEALKKAQTVSYSFFGITIPKFNSHETYDDLISSLNFSRPCELSSNIQMGDTLLQVVVAKNMLLRTLNVRKSIDPKLLTQIFENHLFSTCRLHLPADAITNQIVDILIRKKVTIKYLYFKSFRQAYENVNTQALSRLFGHVPIEALKISSVEVYGYSLDDFMNTLLCLKDNPNSPKDMSLDFGRNFKREQFVALADSGIFRGPQFKLALYGEWIDQVMINCLAAQASHVTFKKFKTLDGAAYSLHGLIEQNVFKDCETFFPQCGDYATDDWCIELSKSSALRKLSISFTEFRRSRLRKLLLDPDYFKSLQTLIISDVSDFDLIDFGKVICVVRPNLFLRASYAEEPFLLT